jgi:threonine dehydratase
MRIDSNYLPSLNEIFFADKLLQQKRLSSPLLPLEESLLIKCDGQLPGGSYKIRGVENFVAHLDHHDTVQVLSAGNLALATTLRLNQSGIICEAVVPETISATKRDRLEQAGARIQQHPFHYIWELVCRQDLRESVTFLHPFNRHLLAGYGSLLCELQRDGFKHGALVVPYGLGGLAVSIAHAIELFSLDIQLYIAEIEGHAPFTRAMSANQPVTAPVMKGFIEAMGLPAVLDDVYQYLKHRIAGVLTVTEVDVRYEINTIYQQTGLRIEGAAGASLAAAKTLSGPVTALLTGSNLSEAYYLKAA